MRISRIAKARVAAGIFALASIGQGGQVIAVDSEAVSAYNSGIVQLNAKQYPQAEKNFQKAIDPDPSIAFAHWELGAVRTELHHYEEALPELQKAVSINPRLAGAWNSLGICLVSMGRLNEAIAAFKKYLALEPNGQLAPNLRKAIPNLQAEAADQATRRLLRRRMTMFNNLSRPMR